MMRDTLRIRPARPADAEVAAVLLYSAYTHTPVTYPLREDHASGWIEHLQHYFSQAGNRFSYQNTQVIAQHSQVVGLVLSFGGRDEARLNAAVGGWLEREADDDDWYVDALAVLEDWGHRGFGTRLLRHAERQARQHHYPRIALHVAPGNKEALALYTRLSYVVTQQAVLYERPYVRMEKQLEIETR
ncbi:MAG TPA: N-acetyltransferase [Ktedonobacterales bacterium]